MKNAKDRTVNIISSRDQLKLILEKLGKQDEQDVSFITEDSVRTYQNDLSSNKPKINFKDLFPNTSDQLLSMLHGLLEYNPGFRLSSKQCLMNPIFDDIRDASLERSSIS